MEFSLCRSRSRTPNTWFQILPRAALLVCLLLTWNCHGDTCATALEKLAKFRYMDTAKYHEVVILLMYCALV